MSSRISFASGFVATASVAMMLAGCNPSADTQMQSQADAYLRANIETLSPRATTLGGHFTVSDVTWLDADTARVTYTDGHVQYVGTADIRTDGNGVVSATTIRLDGGLNSSSMMDDSSSSAMMNDGSSSMPMNSSMSSSSSSSSVRGTSSSSSSSSSQKSSSSSSLKSSSSLSSSSSSFSRARAQKGEFCGGIAGIMCATGLTCDYDGTYPDAGGTCI